MKFKKLFFIFALFCAFCSICKITADKYLPSFQKVSVYDYYKINKNNLYLVFEDEIIVSENISFENDEQVYVPVEFVKEKIDKYIFWDEAKSRLSITTENKVIHMQTDELTYYVNNKPMQLNFPVYKFNNIPFVPKDILEKLYNVKVSRPSKTNAIIIDLTDKSYTIANILATSKIRFEANIKSPIAAELEKGSEVVVFEDEDIKDERFRKIRTENGIVGYIVAKNIEITEETVPVIAEQAKPINLKKSIEGKVVLVWDQIDNADANKNKERFVVHEGVNVLSPTWFSFDGEAEILNSDIINIADKNYVEFAHQNNYQVWGLVSDNFNSKISHKVLSSADARDNVIRQILAFCATYDLDGINIDFEQVLKEDATNFLQFLRELTPLLHEQGVVVSVDMYVPSSWSMYYNRTEIGNVVDYICVMAYDEHYAGSETSGPVASIGFVDKGASDTLLEVPKEKILLGIPLYTRVWKETEDGKISSRAYSMERALKLFKDENVELEWLPDKGVYYGEYSKVEEGKNVTYKSWLEDTKSIEEKLKVAKKYDLAGVAFWKRGLEKDNVWEITTSILN